MRIVFTSINQGRQLFDLRGPLGGITFPMNCRGKIIPFPSDISRFSRGAYLTGRANAEYARVTTNRKSPLVSVAISLSRPISNPHGCVTIQRLGLAVVSGPLQKHGMKSSGVCFFNCSGLRGPDRFTATKRVPKARRILISRHDYPQNRPSLG
jgi:hypothetical protein